MKFRFPFFVQYCVVACCASVFPVSPAASGQSGYTFYVTGPNQDLTGTADSENIGFNRGWQMTYTDVQTMNESFTLSGTWTGGPGVDAYFLANITFRPAMNGYENGMFVSWEGPEITVSLDLTKVNIIEADNGELDRLYIQCVNPCDFQNSTFKVPLGIDDINVGGASNLTILGSSKPEAFSGAEGGPLQNVIIYAGGGDDILIASGDNNQFFGEAGNDGLGGADSILGSTYAGGTGDDSYMVYSDKNKFVELPNQGFDSLYIYIDGYTITPENSANIEQVVMVNQPDENGNYPTYTLNGSDGADRIIGNDANNTISGQGSGDSLNGGVGNDTIIGDSTPAAVAQRAQAVAPAVQAVAIGGNDIIDGGAGSDVAVYSGSYSDYTISFSGALQAHEVRDRVANRDGIDTVRNVEFVKFLDQTLAIADAVNAIAGTATANRLVATATVSDVFGFGGNDTLLGNANNNYLDGGSGADSMTGGDGDDTYIVDSASDRVIETNTANSGTDTVRTTLPSYTLPANVENLIYIGTGNFTGTGNALSNDITGGPGRDSLNGGTGVDTLNGLAGDDSYVIDTIADLVLEDVNGGVDTVSSPVTITTLYANVENLTLTGTGALSGTGNALNNVLRGNTGANVLTGGGGSDTFIGGAGNDSFYGETSSQAGNDTDTVSFATATAAITFSLNNTAASQATGGAGSDRLFPLSSIENLIGGNAADNLTGTDGVNRIDGGAGNDVISLLLGADTVYGNAGRDSIDLGNDADADVVGYVVQTESSVGATTRDVITNFKLANDRIDLSAIDADTRTTAAGNQTFTFNNTTPRANSVWYTVSGANIIVRGDVNGNTTADFEIQINGIANIAAVNFSL